MKKITTLFSLATMLALPVIVSAQEFNPDDNALRTFFNSILAFINGTIIPFILGIGFLVFVWGMFRYFIAGGSDPDKQTSGKQLMVWSILGFVLIIIFWGVVNLFATATGFENQSLQNVPGINGVRDTGVGTPTPAPVTGG